MRELYPNPGDDVDPFARYGADDRGLPGGERPWVLVNMIATVDGAHVDGVRAASADRPTSRVRRHSRRRRRDPRRCGNGAGRVLRLTSDPPVATPPLAGHRHPLARHDLTSAVFTDAPPTARLIVVTTERSDAASPHWRVAEVMIAGDDDVDVGTGRSPTRAQREWCCAKEDRRSTAPVASWAARRAVSVAGTSSRRRHPARMASPPLRLSQMRLTGARSGRHAVPSVRMDSSGLSAASEQSPS